ncbi:hypothetical protein SAG0170_10495 [Streptococcus agalactiae LDS 617]|nr:hypothetical protein SAG0170_10495 [Streptococcus agalactiae LDS 617]
MYQRIRDLREDNDLTQKKLLLFFPLLILLMRK